MNLVGKFICVSEDDSYRTGEVVEATKDQQYYLVKFDKMNSMPSHVLEVIAIDVMAHETDSSPCYLFASRKEMDDWLEWLEEPNEQLVKPAAKEKSPGRGELH